MRIFGKDTTADWTLFGLKSTQTLGILGVVFIIAVTFFGSKGLKNIQKVASIGGIACMFLNVMLIGGALLVLIGNKGELAQPITSVASFVDSPNPEYAGSIAMLAFLVYALFAYGGTEAVGGLVDETENPGKRNFGKWSYNSSYYCCSGIFNRNFLVWESLQTGAIHFPQQLCIREMRLM